MSFQVKKIGRSPKKRQTFTAILHKLTSKVSKKAAIPNDPKHQADSKKIAKSNSFIKKLRTRYQTRKLSLVFGAFLIFGGVYFAYGITKTGYNYIKNFELKELVFMWGAELDKSPNNFTNILVVGTGGQQHESPDLTDSIMVVSIDENSGTVSMLSIPRDLYFRDYWSRINKIFYTAKQKYLNKFSKEEDEAVDLAMNTLKDNVEEFLNVDIQYYIKTDFKAFQDIVDALGGITLHVKEAINDPYYPDDKTYGYDPFKIDKGVQQLDGETALKYVRSRKTTSDYDRSQRQRQVVLAIKESAMSREVLTSPTKIKELYNSVQENVVTDLSILEIITLAKIATSFHPDSIISYGLHDDPLNPGGFLYTPPRDQYDGAFVLVPHQNETIHEFVSLLFNHRQVYVDKPEIVILNGTSRSGLATKIFYHLQRFGLNTIDATNTIDKEKFTENIIYYPQNNDEAVGAIFTLIKEDWTMLPCLKNEENQENIDENFEPNIYCDEYDDKIVVIAGEDFNKNSIALSYVE